MKKLILSSFIFFIYGLKSQTFIQTYQDRVNMVTQANINNNLQEFVSYGIKTTGSAENTNALNWLKTKYLSYGYTASQIEEDPFTFNNWSGSTVNSKNLIITKTGTLYPNTYVIICGHFDTINGPGANDNGTGVSIILEIARILKDVPTEYSIKFINFSGEEQGLYGSHHYVDNVANATTPKMDIKVVFNIDEVGGIAGQVNNIVRCDVDYYAPTHNNAASQAMADQLAACTTLYSPLQTDYYGAFSSDYEPFHEDGYVVTGFYEYNESDHPHTPTDVIANLDPVYVYNIAKAAVGAAQHFAVASTTLGVNENSVENTEIFDIYPNPANQFIQLKIKNGEQFELEILDSNGRLITLNKNKTKIDVSSLPSGIYLAKLNLNGKIFTKKFIIEK